LFAVQRLLGNLDSVSSLDGSCTRSSMLERHSDFSNCPQGYERG